MTEDFAPEFYQDIKNHLRRSEWGIFPDVVIHADESTVKKHSMYVAAKNGDTDAAEELILGTSTLGSLDSICSIVGDRQPSLIAVHAQENKGINVIPWVFAQILSTALKLPLATSVIQINRVSHTGSDGYHRLAFPALILELFRQANIFLLMILWDKVVHLRI